MTLLKNLFATALLNIISQAASAETRLRGYDGVWTVRAQGGARYWVTYIRRQLRLDSECTREDAFGRHDPCYQFDRCRSKSWVRC